MSKAQQGRQFLLVEFLYAYLDVLGQHEIEKSLLLAIKAGADSQLRAVGTFLGGQRR